MSITPTDKPPDADEPADTPLSRRAGRLRDGVERFLGALVDGVRSLGQWLSPDDSSVDSDHTARRRDARPDARSDRSPPDLDGFPERERPLTYPGREVSGVNSPDVVSVETDQGLRLSVPENPDATIVSDVWTTVDP